ncbi:cytochrome b/b6 domain-containing protein [Agriterribacter sp.]|uniref:cytochrome b/b6 domain-containing protein n=1 Tax=Agriterribacter sp. TaxID=2821509 RepID=UPI002B73A0AE|nr:cytochrome b/b6 domain-containing protein [Agriterribacter sp.]HTN09247.1 cytochrome b/b6 domain-containing protein [Agriterribacter sp.]
MSGRKFTITFRLMHWAIALCIVLLLITIFLRMNWMNKDQMAGIIDANLKTLNISLTQDQLIKMAKEIRKPMWNWHIYIGYALIGLYGLRMILPFFGQMEFRNPFSKMATLKEKLQAWIYIVFYFFLGISLATGLLIEAGPKNLKDSLEAVHILSLYYLLPFIILHFGGVLLAEVGSQKGIISKMVSG